MLFVQPLHPVDTNVLAELEEENEIEIEFRMYIQAIRH